MVRIVATQIVDVQGNRGVINHALKELAHQVHVEFADHGAREVHVVGQTRPARQIHHHAAQRLVERHIGVTIAAQALLVADGLRQRLTDGDADVFHGVMAVNV